MNERSRKITIRPAEVLSIGGRVETGTVQFIYEGHDVDWPGIFIRGDDALAFSMYLQQYVKSTEQADWDPIVLNGVQNLIALLSSCDVRKQD